MNFKIEFWSSVELVGFQNALVRELRLAGYPTEERFLVSRAKYWTAYSRLQRLAMRTQCYGIYPVWLRRHFRCAQRHTIGVVCSNTFYAPWVAIRAAGPRARIIHWIFDLYPDVLLSSGWLKTGGYGEKALRQIMRRTFDSSAANVFLGENLRRHAEAKFGAIPRTEVIEVGADGDPYRESKPATLIDTGGGEVLTALYCGNIGHMHEIETFTSALNRVGHLPIHFRFLGNGPAFNTVKAWAISSSQVSFGRNLELPEWVAAMKAAGLALVLLKEDAGALVMPSKTYSALMAGQAILAICPRTSDLANLVQRHDAGWVVSPGDVAGLVQILTQIASAPSEVLRRRQNAWHAGHAFYEQRVIARRWLTLIKTVGELSSIRNWPKNPQLR